MLYTVVQLGVVVDLVLFGNLSNARCKLDASPILQQVPYLLQELLTCFNITLSRVEGRQDDGLGLCVLQDTIFVGVKHSVNEGVTFVLWSTLHRVIAIVAFRVRVSVLAADVILFSLREQLY